MAESRAEKAADTATSKKGQSVVKKTVGAAGKAVGAEVAGGGPEDPAADILALKEATKGSKPKAKAAPAKKAAPVKKSRRSRALAWAWSGNKKMLIGEFILVIVIVGLGALTSTGSVKDELHKTMIKASALAGLFFLLAIVAGTGKNAARAATALGTLVTVAYVFTSPEAHSIVGWISSFFAPPQNQTTPGTSATAGATAGTNGNPTTGTPLVYQGVPEGTLGPGGTYTSTTGSNY